MAHTTIYHCDICGKETTNEASVQLRVEVRTFPGVCGYDFLFTLEDICMDCFNEAQELIAPLNRFLRGEQNPPTTNEEKA